MPRCNPVEVRERGRAGVRSKAIRGWSGSGKPVTKPKKGLGSVSDEPSGGNSRMTRAEHLKALFTGCGIAAALEVVGERWSFLILRGAFNGLEHFEEFQSTLGIARNILSNRLVRLVEHGILAREPDPSDRRRVAYKLTEKGVELMPVLIALRQWGERWICHQDRKSTRLNS